MDELLEERIKRLESLILSQKRVLSFDEAITYTGMSKSFLYKLTSQKKIPHYKPSGKIIFFERIELENWLLTNKIAK